MFARTPFLARPGPTTQLPQWVLRDLPLFVFLVFNSAQGLTPLVLGVDGTPGSTTLDPESGNLFTQLLIMWVIGSLFLWHTLNRFSLKLFLLQIWPLVPIAIWILASVVWSDYPDISLRRAIRFFLEVIAMVLFAAAYRDQIKILRVIYAGFAAVILLDLAMLGSAQAYSSIGFVGIHTHKNQTGAFCFLAIPVFLAALMDRRISHARSVPILFLALSIALLVFSQSKTGLTLLPVCLMLAFFFVQLGRAHNALAPVIMIVGFLLGLIFLLLVLNFGVGNFLDYVFSDASLTGRDRVWDFVMYRISQDPIIGHGYGAIWYVGAGTFQLAKAYGLTWDVEEAHNAYLDIAAQLGMVGLVLTILLLFGTIFRLWRFTADPRADRIIYIGVYAIFGIILYSITETILLRAGSDNWLFFLLTTQAIYSCASAQAQPVNWSTDRARLEGASRDA
jgi:exopolysaccharide production protein ExoQ